MALPTSPARQRHEARPRATTGPLWRGFPGVYRPRPPTQTPLYQVVQHHLETFLARASAADPMGYGLPAWVERDFRGYLECGMTSASLWRASGRPPLVFVELPAGGFWPVASLEPAVGTAATSG
jgi:hypothetical protein